MGAELSRKRRGKEPRTGMSESQLEEFASKSVEGIMEKNVIKTISKYLKKQQRHPDPHGPDAGKRPSGQGLTGPPGKPSMRNPYPATQEESTSAKKRLGPAMDPAGYSVDKQEPNEDFKTALDAFSTKPKTPKEAGVAAEDRRKYDEAAAKITPPKRVIAKENDYPPTKGERRDAKRVKAKKMKVTGAGAKISQRIIGERAAAAGGMDKAKPNPKRDALRDMGLTQRTSIPKPREMDLPSDPKPTQVSIGGRKLQLKTAETNIIKAINKFLGKQTSEHTSADPEAAKRAASRARQEADVGKPMPSPFVSRTPDPLTGKKPPKKPKPSWAAAERPEGAQRTSAGGGGGMVAFGKKKEKQLVKAISTYLKEDTPKYNKKAVDAAIKRDKSIGKKEAKAIHGLLRGRQKSDS